MKINLPRSFIWLAACLINGILCSNAETKRDYVLDEFFEEMGPTPKTLAAQPNFWSNVIPSPGTPITSLLTRRQPTNSQETKDLDERQLDSIGGYHIDDYRSQRDELPGDVNDIYQDESGNDEAGRLSKRDLDTLGDMQIHGYKRGFDTLGGMNLHSGYKRYLSSLGGSQIHDYKRGFDTLGGSNLHAYKRYLSSLGGGNIHAGFKRSLDNLDELHRHGGYKRYLSSLGGGNIYDYKKRGFDSLGGAHLHGGWYNKRYLSSLGGGMVHDGGYKRTLSSLGGMNIHGGVKRELSSLGGAEIYGYKRNADREPYDFFGNSDDEMEKRQFGSLGGFNVHRFKRSDEKAQDVEEANTESNAEE